MVSRVADATVCLAGTQTPVPQAGSFVHQECAQYRMVCCFVRLSMKVDSVLSSSMLVGRAMHCHAFEDDVYSVFE